MVFHTDTTTLRVIWRSFQGRRAPKHHTEASQRIRRAPTKTSQGIHRGLAEDSQRIHRGFTEDSQRIHRGCTEDSQRTHRGLREDPHRGFTKVLQRTCPQRLCYTRILMRFFLYDMHHTWVLRGLAIKPMPDTYVHEGPS